MMMTYALRKCDLASMADIGKKFSEVLIGLKSFSRYGQFEAEEMAQVLKKCKEHRLRSVLEWDILMTQEIFTTKSSEIIKILNQFDFAAVRVQDFGALDFILENTSLPIQLNLESAHHNLSSLKILLTPFKERLERLVLSIEVPCDQILDYAAELREMVTLEVLGRGPILLYHSPRNLLSAAGAFKDSKQTYGMTTGQSEETPHKNFSFIENTHGVFMFFPKDHSVGERSGELKEKGVVLREDYRHLPGDETFLSIFENYPRKTFQGYFRANRSDRTIKKLKNPHLNRLPGLIGEVIDVVDRRYLLIQTASQFDQKVDPPLFFEKSLQFKTPKGSVKVSNIRELLNLDFSPAKNLQENSIYLIGHIGGIPPMTQIYQEI